MTLSDRVYGRFLRIVLILIFLFVGFHPRPGQGQEISPKWEEAVNISHSLNPSESPSLAVDPSGRVHIVWVESVDGEALIYYSTSEDGNSWTAPLDILLTPGGGPAYIPVLKADGDGYLHIVWKGAGSVFYSYAYAPAAASAHAWSEPQPISPAGHSPNFPDLAIDEQKGLHVVYAHPVGNDSGIYYLHSAGRAQSWSPATTVYVNPLEDRMVDKPRLTVAPDGTIHTVWVEYDYPNTFPPRGIRYARSTDGGKTWSRAISLADGPYDDPAIVVRGIREVHIVWSGTTSDRFKFHRWSADGGRNWSEVWRNTELGGFQGRPALVVDGGQHLHWLQSGSIFAASNDGVYYNLWNGVGWLPGTLLLPGTAHGQNPGSTSAAVGLGNELHVAVQYPIDLPAGGWQMEVFYLHGPLPIPGRSPVSLPSPTFPPTLTPTTRSLPEEISTPRPSLPPKTPESGVSLSLPGSPLPAMAVSIFPVLLLIGAIILLSLHRQRR